VLKVAIVAAPQLSEALGTSKLHACPRVIVRFGRAVSVGGVVSFTRILYEQVFVFPLASRASHVRMIV